MTSLEPGTIGFEMVRGLPAALVALIIGAIAAVIAYQQWRVARARLNLDLFEQRYALFELLWAFLAARAQDLGHADEATRNLRHALPKFYFLFGPEIGDEVAAALSRADRHDAAFSVSSALRPTAEDPAGARQWFDDEARRARDRFAAYLDFQRWT